MLRSKNDFFFKTEEELLERREQLIFILTVIWGKSDRFLEAILESYDYFCSNPGDYDGATIVADFYILPGLDIFAMIHDYMYIVFKVSSNMYYKVISDYIYCDIMRDFKVHWIPAWVIRFGGLLLSTPIFFAYKKFYKKIICNKGDKKRFINYITKLRT